MKKNIYFFLIMLSLSTMVSCGGRERRSVNSQENNAASPDSIVPQNTSNVFSDTSSEQVQNKEDGGEEIEPVTDKDNTLGKKAENADNQATVSTTPQSQPLTTKLNNLLYKIENSDDKAIDEIRRTLGNNVSVEGAANISNVQQLITDVSNGNHYKITGANRDANGKIISIRVSK